MNAKQAKQLKIGTKLHITGFFRNSVEAIFIRFENGLIFVNTTGTKLDERRSQVDIDNELHQIEVFPKFAHLEEVEVQGKKTSFDQPIGCSRKFGKFDRS